MLTNRGLILAKEEVTYGVDPTPTAAANSILAGNPQLRVDANLVTRQFLRDNISRLSAVVGRKLWELTFFTEIKGSGTAGTAPKHGVLNIGCGMSETVVAVTSVTYAPVSTGFKSLTLYFYTDGLLCKLTGAYGTKRVVMAVGEFGRFEYTFRGIFNIPTDAATPGGAVFDTTKPQPIKNLGLTLGAYAPVGANLNIDMGIQISERVDFNAAEGLKGLNITNREIGGTIDPEAVTEATHSFWANFIAGTEVALAGNMIGATAGNKCAITGPKLQYEGPQLGDRAGTRIYNLPFRMNPSVDSASDEYSEAYT